MEDTSSKVYKIESKSRRQSLHTRCILVNPARKNLVSKKFSFFVNSFVYLLRWLLEWIHRFIRLDLYDEYTIGLSSIDYKEKQQLILLKVKLINVL